MRTEFESYEARGGEEIHSGLQEQPDEFFPFRAGSLFVLHGAPDRDRLVPGLHRSIDGPPLRTRGLHRVRTTVEEHPDTARPSACSSFHQSRIMEKILRLLLEGSFPDQLRQQIGCPVARSPTHG